jgi:hypothetical protein
VPPDRAAAQGVVPPPGETKCLTVPLRPAAAAPGARTPAGTPGAERRRFEKRTHMAFSYLFLIVAAILFFLSTVPKIQQPWMIGIGLALAACSQMPFARGHLG